MSVEGHTMTTVGTWIEGVGDEVVMAVVAFLELSIPILLLILQRNNRSQTIHPESEANVQTARDQVNQQRHTINQQNIDADTGHAIPSAPPLPNEPTHRPITENHGQHQCPICLGTTEFAVQTNCGHLFCGVCLTTYWHHGSWLGAVNCPVCRQTVTLLLINFTHQEHNSSSDEKTTVVDAIYQYNRRFSGEPRTWMEHLQDLPTLLRHAVGEFFSFGGLVWMFRLRVIVCFIAALLYFISPFDIIPEAVFGIIGFFDDFFILLLLAVYVGIIYRQVVANRAQAAQ